MSAEREWSLADRFIAVMAEVNAITEGVDNEHFHRYPIRCMQHAAQKVIFDALTTARDIAHAAGALKHEENK